MKQRKLQAMMMMMKMKIALMMRQTRVMLKGTLSEVKVQLCL